MTDLGRHAANLVGLESNQDLAAARAIDQPLLNTTAGRVGQFVGQTAATAPLGMGVGAGLGRLGALGARLAANPLTMGATQGAVQGGLLADPGQRLQGAALGGGLGAALPGIAGLASSAIRGLARTPAAQALLDKGISLTPGQMNPTGTINRFEQLAEGVPGVGDMVRRARTGAIQQYNRAMVNDAMAPGATLSGPSADFNGWIDEAAKSFDTAYDGAKGFPMRPAIMHTDGPDVPLSTALKAVSMRPRIGLTSSDRQGWASQLNDQLNETTKGGLSSDKLIQLRSSIRDSIRAENGDTNASRATRDLLKDAEGQVTQALESQLPPQVSSQLRATDQQFAKFAIMRNAAKAAKDTPGGPSPYQISTAIANATEGNTYARGGGLGRDLSKAARDTFQNNVERTGFSSVLGVGVPAAAAYLAKGLALSHPVIAGAAAAPLVGAGALALTQGGRNLAAGNTAIQRAMASGLNRMGGLMGPNVNLPELYARSGLLASQSKRLQRSGSDQ
jgi:hypothetical protein